jgi:hypothetical protein
MSCTKRVDSEEDTRMAAKFILLLSASATKLSKPLTYSGMKRMSSLDLAATHVYSLLSTPLVQDNVDHSAKDPAVLKLLEQGTLVLKDYLFCTSDANKIYVP